MRKIDSKLLAYIDQHIHKADFEDAMEYGDPRSLMVAAAQSLVGIKETSGENRGGLVDRMIYTTPGVPLGSSWCMCFVQAIIAYVEDKMDIQSPVITSAGVLDTWNRTSKDQRVKKIPAPGAIVIFQHGNSALGHTGIVVKVVGDKFHAIEGNTGGGVISGKIERDGDGVYETIRPLAGFGNMRTVGFLKPF